MPGGKTSAIGAEYLRRVVAARLADRFNFQDVLDPMKRMRFVAAFEHLIEQGLVERVNESCGKWWYRLTDEGRAIGAATKPNEPRRRGKPKKPWRLSRKKKPAVE